MKMLFTILMFLSFHPSYSFAGECEAEVVTALKDDSLKSGILMHGEHWVDLILRQAGTADPRPFRVFTETLKQLVKSISAGRFERVNEKIDGSPSVVFGFDGKGKPFVAYKGHFTKKSQTLVTSAEEAEAHFKRSPALKKIFATLFAAAREPLGKAKKFKSYIFQGDLLFVAGDDRRKVDDEAVTIQANSVTYKIAHTNPIYSSLREAQAGVVFHTVGEQVVGEDGRISVRALSETAKEEKLVREFVAAVNSQALFAMDPWRDNVDLAAQVPETFASSIDARLVSIREALQSLSPEFRQRWARDFELKFRTFFNSGLRPPHDGGFYKIAAANGALDADEWSQKFSAWLRGREEDVLAEKFGALIATHRSEMNKVIHAYASAIAIQYAVQPFMKEALVSKLGGGDEVEGLMLKTSDSVVKWVDRLEFTMRNNARWNRGGQQAPVGALTSLPAPLNEWRPGSSFVVLKGQPIHAGHIQLIREAAAQNPGTKIFVLASDKEPNLNAKEWRDLKATDTKKEMQQQNYVYIFSNQFREKLLREGLKDIDAEVTVISPGLFWSYVRTAKAQSLEGKIKLVVGEKEIAEGRYDLQLQELGQNFELQSIPLKAGGISATDVRKALKAAAIGVESERSAALAVLDKAFSYLADELARRRALQDAIEQWRKVDEIARRLVAAKKAG